MKRPTPAPDDLEDLIALCLELHEARGASAVDEVLADRPDSAELVRERLDLLGRMGLVGAAPEHSIPARIGDYRIVGVLGRGGMGVVYEAEQERPRRRVALKVLRSLPGSQGRSRFLQEAEVLARLQHPGIAAIYEAGTAVVGGLTVPFFAMELVRGQSLDVVAAEARLDLRARAALVARIADAVHHAHQKGVVHRDLKPANVIVDEGGKPRVLDFGIARAIDPDLKLETLRTEVGQIVGTLAYMSPEQSAGEVDDIDSQTDVYALGVLAFELFSGRLPHEVEGRPVLEVLQAIRDVDPPRLGALDRALRGDLETIVTKALAKEKERRYSSAHELAADLRRFLNHEPIAARPATATYQLSKFARRHRGLVVGAAAVFVALILGLAGTIYGLVRAESERDDAERRFREANLVRGFQSGMFSTADPHQDGVLVEDLLDRAALTIDAVGQNPTDQASVRLMMGQAFAGVGAFEKAEPFLREAADVFERELGVSDLQTLESRRRIASLFIQTGRLQEAQDVLPGIIDAAVSAYGDDHDIVLDAQLTHANLLLSQGRHEAAVQLCRGVARVSGAGSPRWSDAKGLSAVALSRLGDNEGAVAGARDAYEYCRAQRGEEHPATLSARSILAHILQEGGRFEESGQVYEELLATCREVMGDTHTTTIYAMVGLSTSYHARGDHARAGELLSEAVATASRDLPVTHPALRVARGNLAVNLIDRGRFAEAEELLWRELDLQTETLGPEHIDVLASMTNLASVVQEQGRYDEAEELHLATLETSRRVQGDRHPKTIVLIYNIGCFYRDTKNFQMADTYLREAAEAGPEVFLETDYRRSSLTATWALNLGHLGRFDAADEALLQAQAFADPLSEDHPAREKVRAIREQLKGLRVAHGG